MMATKPNIMKFAFAFSLPLVFASGLLLGIPEVNGSPNQATASQDLLVLSYNICWQCMTNTESGSAANFGKACVYSNLPYKTTICAERMGQFIESIPKSNGLLNFDFVGFQEASKWQSISKLAPQTLGQMEFETSQSGFETMVSFYSSKYTLQQAIKDEFNSGRPFQILIFKEKMIFINLHNNHSLDMAGVESKLSQSLSDNLSPKISINDLKDYRIIVVGDFNFGGTKTVTMQPFSNTALQTKCTLHDPAVSCCDEEVPSAQDPWNGFRSGDFIFDSGSTSHPVMPLGYDLDEPQSDHLPVVAKLPGN